MLLQHALHQKNLVDRNFWYLFLLFFLAGSSLSYLLLAIIVQYFKSSGVSRVGGSSVHFLCFEQIV